MNFNNYKNIRLNKKEIIGVAVLVTASTAATMAITYRKTLKEKNQLKETKNKELSNLIDELDRVSNKIVELSQGKEQLEILMKEKAALKDNFMLKPY